MPEVSPEATETLRLRLAVAGERLAALALAPAQDVGVWVRPDMAADRIYLDCGLRRLFGLDPAPLRHAASFSQVLREDYAAVLDDAGLGHLRAIERAVGQSTDMIRDLLAYARTGTTALQPEAIDLRALCGKLRAQLTAGGRAGHVRWHIGALPTVYADRTQMMMLFQNLLANAVKFTSGRPDAQVEVFAGEGTERECEVVVRDNGIGFAPEECDYIFGAFARSREASKFEGTSIDLANVARIVARHGGRITAYGAKGKGATFRVFLRRDPPSP